MTPAPTFATPATRSLPSVLRSMLELGQDLFLLTAEYGPALNTSDPDLGSHVNIVVAGQTTKVPALAGLSAIPGTPAYVLVTKDFLIAIGSVGAPGAVSSGVPIGGILPFGGDTPPLGFLLCTGAQVSKATYALLYAVLGNRYGETGTTFGLPDLRRRVAVGSGTGYALGATEGLAEADRGPFHHHHFSDAISDHSHGSAGDHSHSFSGGLSGSSGGAGGHSHGPVGDHQHPSAGAHAHDLPSGWSYAGTSGATAALGTGGTSRYIIGGIETFTTTQGSHQHGGAGGHDHGSVGDHSHSISGSVSGSTGSGGSHSHPAAGAATVDGDTSGGGGQDVPAYVVLHYLIRAL
jgi:microcystin-dependent protein